MKHIKNNTSKCIVDIFLHDDNENLDVIVLHYYENNVTMQQFLK